jgi:DNA-directed RNA polymerase subunit RPC12/RpoP
MSATDEEIKRLTALLDQRQKEEMDRFCLYFSSHEEDESLELRCQDCGAVGLVERANLKFHNHAPYGIHVDEIYECSSCGKYMQVIYIFDSIRAIK